jgi:hypothetical protein
MTDVTTTEPETIPAFPAQEIETCIRDYLTEEGETQAVLRGGGASTAGTGESAGPRPTIDSLVVVSVLCEIEPAVPFKLPDSLVRAGGYDTVDEVIQHIMPKLKKRWRKHHEEKS